MPFPLVRKAQRPNCSDSATAAEALGVVLDECLAQITRNAVGLVDGAAWLWVAAQALVIQGG
jgi:hypothetical protein